MTQEAIQVVEAESRRVVVERLELATTFGRRLVGLQFRRKLSSGSGLLLAPCPSIHTCFLRFPIDVIWLDRQGTVVDKTASLSPWRIAAPARKAWAALEIPAGSTLPPIDARLRLLGASAEALPRYLRSWLD